MAQWDFGRLLKTLQYFGTIPFVGDWPWVQQLLGTQSPNPLDRANGRPTVTSGNADNRVVLVLGASGGLGKRVVRQLLARNYRVRAFVRDRARAEKVLQEVGVRLDDPRLSLLDGDVTVPETLPAAVRDIRAVANCIGTRVQPVEGDQPDREKYYQGTKFYLPEVADSPEQVEYRGMQNLLAAAGPVLQAEARQPDRLPIFDFRQPDPQLAQTWGALDDVVMGGVSESGVRWIDGAALFSGTVSVENSGGFVSVRTRNFERPLNLGGYDGIELRVKGDGQRYKLILRDDPRWDSVAYCASFDTVFNIWTTVRVPFDRFVPVFRARTLRDRPPLNARQIASMQVMLSKFEYDGDLNPRFRPGEFGLQLESVQAYGGASLPRFVHVSSAGVTRVGKPGLNLEEEPPAVRLNDRLGGLLTWKREGEKALEASGIPYAIVRPCALTEEPGGKQLVLDRGDTMRGKVSREDVADLCVRLLEMPEAANLTFEVRAKDEPAAASDWGDRLARLQGEPALA